MRTVSDAVETIIGRSPFLSEMIASGLANNAHIARAIKPGVERELYEKVSEGAIAMALYRLSKNLKTPMFGTKLLKHIRGITVRSNLAQFVFSSTVDLSEALKELSRISKRENDSFLNYSRGLSESTLIVSENLAEEAARALRCEKNLKRVEKLAAITMRLPERSLSVPGVYYPLLRALAQEGINLVEVMSVRTEFSVIVEDSDVDRAFSVIKKMTT